MGAVPLGVYIAGAALAGTEVYSSVDTAGHAKTDANNAANVAQDNANTAIASANQQQLDKQNQQANATQVAQSRVRALSNPDADSIMTSPLGQVGTSKANPGGTQGTSQVPSNPSNSNPGTIMTPGKTTIGG